MQGRNRGARLFGAPDRPAPRPCRAIAPPGAAATRRQLRHAQLAGASPAMAGNSEGRGRHGREDVSRELVVESAADLQDRGRRRWPGAGQGLCLLRTGGTTARHRGRVGRAGGGQAVGDLFEDEGKPGGGEEDRGQCGALRAAPGRSRPAQGGGRRLQRPVLLHERGTQTVFGEGPARRAVMLVGEQPGDQEDRRAGRSSARPGRCSTARSQEAGSPATRSTSPTRSSTSSGSRAASGGSTQAGAREIQACRRLEAEIARDRAGGHRVPRRDRGPGLARRKFRLTRSAASRTKPRALRDGDRSPLRAAAHPEDDAERKAAIKELVRELQKVADLLGQQA